VQGSHEIFGAAPQVKRSAGGVHMQRRGGAPWHCRSNAEGGQA
jgi:hypothetical protein